MLTDRHDKILRLLIDPVMCPDGYRIQKGDQGAIQEALNEIGRLSAELTQLRAAFAQYDYEVEQILGRALGYPKFVDDQKNFPGATDADGVCVGEHIVVTLAEEAAERIGKLQDEISQLNERLRRMRITYDQRTREYVEDALRMRQIDRGCT